MRRILSVILLLCIILSNTSTFAEGEQQFDNLVHVILLDNEGEEINSESRFVDWETTEYFNVPLLYEEKLLHNPRVIERIGEGRNWGFKDGIIGEKLRVINLAKEEDDADFSYTIIIQYESFQPHAKVNYFSEGELIENEIIEFNDLGEKIITAKEIEGYDLVDTKEKNIILNYPNFTQSVEFNYSSKKENEYSGYATLQLINAGNNETFYNQEFNLIEEKYLNIPIEIFIESGQLEIGDYIISSNSNDGDIIINFNHDEFDENYISELELIIPEGIEDFMVDIKILYQKIEPFIRIQNALDNVIINQKIHFVDNLGEHIIHAEEIEGYEIKGEKSETVILNYLNRNTEKVIFNYMKNENEKKTINLIYRDFNSNEFLIEEKEVLIEKETTFEIPVFFENEMLRMTSTSANHHSNNPDTPYKLTDILNLNGKEKAVLTVLLPSEGEYNENVYFNYDKVIPEVIVKCVNEDGVFDLDIIQFSDLEEKNIQAKQIEDYELIDAEIKTVTFSFPEDHPLFTKTLEFKYKRIINVDEPELDESPKPEIEIPHFPFNPPSLTRPIEEKKPEIRNLLKEKFISRWLHHEPLTEKPLKIEGKQKVQLTITKEQKEILEKKGLEPRLYYWNKEKEMWIALSNIIEGDKIETYEEVSGWVAIFGVKQANFSDVKGNEWFSERVDRANGLAIIEGVKQTEGDITLSPEKSITRKEMYALIGRIFGAVQREQTSLYNELDFISEMQGGRWYEPYFHEFHDKGVISRVFTEEEADEEITRLEVLELLTKMLTRVENVKMVDLNEFIDTKEIKNLQIAGIIKGFPDSTLRPHQKITRVETIILLVNALEELGW